MLTAILSRVLSAPDSPTADLYFRNACQDLLEREVTEIAPTVFASATACLVMRHAMRAARLPQRRRLIYMIDDDITAGATDESLPYLYRQKLRMVEQPAGRTLGRFAGTAVVSSPTLARVFSPMMETHQIRPYWSEKPAGLVHFDHLEGPGAMIEMAYLGSSVHRSDLRFLVPVVMELLQRHPNLRFHVPIRHRLPQDMARHARVVPIDAQGWTAYRQEIAKRRFHLALYPLLDTPFNRARSVNKLIEHAVVGAAPVYSSSWREGWRAQENSAGLCLPNEPASWLDQLSQLIQAPVRMRALADGAQRLAAQLNRPEPQQRLWRDLLEVDVPVPA